MSKSQYAISYYFLPCGIYLNLKSMEQFNLTIITLFTSGISFIMGLFMLFLYYSTSKVKGTGYWATCSLIIGFGLLFRFIPPIDGFIGMVIPSIFVTIGLYAYLSGIWSFKEKKINKTIAIGAPVFDTIQSIIFFVLFPSHQIRMVLHAILIITYCVIAIYEMFKLLPEQKYLRKIFRINAISFISYLILVLLSLIAILSGPANNPSDISEAGVILFILSGFIMLALTFGFMSAVNLQLYTEVEGQLKSKTKFLAIIAHDLRGPVGTIMGFLNLLNSETDLKEEQKQQFLQKLELLSQSTFHLLQNLLDWTTSSKSLAHIETAQIDLNQLVSRNLDFLNSLTKFKAINIEFEKGIINNINGNDKLLETVLRNLVSNALKFTPKGGKITISTINTIDKVRLSIKDTGKGMSKEKLQNLFIFEKNESTSGTEGESGSGFGLVLCSEFVKKNQGTIQVKSQLDIGTEVIVEFPFANVA